MKAKRFVIYLILCALGLSLAGAGAHVISPWPMALLIRMVFDRGARTALEKLEKHLPENITEQKNLIYDKDDPAALMDVFLPSKTITSRQTLPAIVWIHGGAFISGRKSDVGNYAKILASHGFVVIALDYSIAPEFQYPTPIRQTMSALKYINRNFKDLKIDPNSFFLAGDSAGAQIAGQLANLITSPEYSKNMGVPAALKPGQLKGVILHCGVFDATLINRKGPLGFFINTVFRSYFGVTDFSNDPRSNEFSVLNNITDAFPPMFISVGNADPLENQSKRLAEKAISLGVPVQTLFFESNEVPALGHEYQFDLDAEPGQRALRESVQFINSYSHKALPVPR